MYTVRMYNDLGRRLAYDVCMLPGTAEDIARHYIGRITSTAGSNVDMSIWWNDTTDLFVTIMPAVKNPIVTRQ